MPKLSAKHNTRYAGPSGIILDGARRRLLTLRRKRISTKKTWRLKTAPNLSLIKRGDLLLTINTRSTPSGLKSQLVAKFGKSRYAHTATYLGEKEHSRMVRDFAFFRGGKTYPLNSLTAVGTNYRVIRWIGAGGKKLDDQIEAFVKNVEATKGKYDNAQLLLYSLYQGIKDEGIKQIIEKHLKKLLDKEKRFTCSEAQAEAGNPYPKQMQEGKRTAVKPPLLFHPTLDKEFVTPAVINAAVKAGLLKLITECEWENHP